MQGLEEQQSSELAQLDFFTILALATFVVCLIIACACMIIGACQHTLQYCHRQHVIEPETATPTPVVIVDAPSVNLTNSVEEVVENIVDFPPLVSPPPYERLDTTTKEKVRFVQPGRGFSESSSKAGESSVSESGHHLIVEDVLTESDVVQDGVVSPTKTEDEPPSYKTVAKLS